MSCSGCGAKFQKIHPNKPGYYVESKEAQVDYHLLESKEILTPGEAKQLLKRDHKRLCQRCHLIKRMNLDMGASIASVKEFESIRIRDIGLIVLIMDCTDIYFSLPSDLFDYVGNKRMLICLNKSDLLPHGFKMNAVMDWIKRQPRFQNVLDIIPISAKSGSGLDELASALVMHKQAGEDIYLVGKTSVGKSTLVNRLRKDSGITVNEITTSSFPGTTSALIPTPLPSLTAIGTEDVLYDTPGIHNEHHLLNLMQKHETKYLIPKILKQHTLELNPHSSLLIGGLVRIDAPPELQEPCQTHIYCGSLVPIKKFKTSKAPLHLTSPLDYIKTVKKSPPLLPMDLRVGATLSQKQTLFMSGLGWMNYLGPGKANIWSPNGLQVDDRFWHQVTFPAFDISQAVMRPSFSGQPSAVKSAADALRDSLDRIRLGIEEAEKQYKQHVASRKQLIPRVFTAADTELLAIQESDIASKARQELLRMRNFEQTQQQSKKQHDESLALELATRISDAKKKFAKRNQFIGADIVSVELITDETFAVFSSAGTLELWHIPSGQEQHPELKQVVHLPTASLSSVTRISLEKMVEEYEEKRTPKSSKPSTPAQQNQLTIVREINMTEPLKEWSNTYTHNGIYAESPPVRFTLTVFCGFQNGIAIVMQIIMKWMHDGSVLIQKQISHCPLTKSFLVPHPTQVYLLAEVSANTGEHLISVMDINLEPIYGYKCDVLRHICQDKQTRMILPAEYDMNLFRGENGRQQPQMLVSSMQWDEYHNCTLLGLDNGHVIRQFYGEDPQQQQLQQDVQEGQKREEANKALKVDLDDPTSHSLEPMDNKTVLRSTADVLWARQTIQYVALFTEHGTSNHHSQTRHL
ncbi:hypothetical protein EDD86DRAFT_197887 [Gorgonomyces haynaldii]|nr:hypothetical protein EDD86DRAFT_197887 [Gorgonomyces haynaldii]